MAFAVTAALAVAPVASAATPLCDTKPIRTALEALEKVGAGISVTVQSPRCGLWTGGVGLADRRTGRKVVGNEHSRIGSNTKTWTATVVLQLAGEDKVRLDDTVERYLPGLIRTKHYDGRKITIRQLLQHTSGLPDYLEHPFWEDEEAHRWDHISPLQTVEQALAVAPPDRTPSGFAYANTNYNLAGLIVTKVTGRDIGTEINQRIIRRLGLCETSWPGDRTTIPKPDLRSYVDRAGKLLAPAQLAEMKRAIPDDFGQGYGLGVEGYKHIPGLTTWGHSGSMASGHKFRNAVTDDGQRAVALLIGSDTFDSDEVDSVIGNLIRDLH